MKRLFFILLVFAVFFSCRQAPEKITKHHSEYHFSEISFDSMLKREKLYVPVYSDIYHIDARHTFPLTATLSIRNVSETDSLFIGRVDYYNSRGEKIRGYASTVFLLNPLESIEFVVENKDDTGGVGANFIVEWGTLKDTNQRPYVQCVMIGTSGQQGISFLTEGIPVKN
jgi:hypothetical protein